MLLVLFQMAVPIETFKNEDFALTLAEEGITGIRQSVNIPPI